jgi:hypothetical protein
MYNSGHFGCIYYPIFFQEESTTIPKTTNRTNHVSQIKKRNNTEIKIHKLIKTIPYHMLYFHTFVSCEPVQLGIMKEEEDPDEEEEKEEEKEPVSSLVLLKYNKFIFHSFDSFTTNKTNKYLSSIYISLLKSIRLLLKTGIIYSIINTNNIIFIDETPIITDFSNAYPANEFETNKLLNPAILEHFVIQYLISHDLSSISISNIYDIINEYKTHPLLKDTTSALPFLKSFINQPTPQIIQKLITYEDTWDNFAISSIFRTLLMERTHCNKFVLKWINLLEENMDANPLKRHTVESTINKMEENVYNAETQDLF